MFLQIFEVSVHSQWAWPLHWPMLTYIIYVMYIQLMILGTEIGVSIFFRKNNNYLMSIYLDWYEQKLGYSYFFL